MLLVGRACRCSDGMDTGFYPLLQSFRADGRFWRRFPLIFVSAGRSRSSSQEGLCRSLSGAWLMSCLAGMLPYVLWGEASFRFVGRVVGEPFRGSRTTGATSLSDVEALAAGGCFSGGTSTHWLGGVGVVMFVLVVLPSMGSTKMRLSSVELSSMAKDNFRATGTQENPADSAGRLCRSDGRSETVSAPGWPGDEPVRGGVQLVLDDRHGRFRYAESPVSRRTAALWIELIVDVLHGGFGACTSG